MSELLTEIAAAGATVLFSSHQLDLVEDVCEDVVIINAGRIVRAGDLSDLRDELPRRFVRVRYRGARPDWSGLADVHLVGESDGEAVLQVARDVDLPALVRVARGTGDLVSFVYQPPTLSELFRQAVGA
jgi:ABC-2 type transport system ATP-binding protein